MQVLKEEKMVEPCDICGDQGFSETIVTCSKCHVNREHCYCMRINTLKIPDYWLCEPCQSKGSSNSPHKVNQNIGPWTSEMQQPIETEKVKFVHGDEVIRLSSGKASTGSKNDEIQKSMTNQHASCPLTKGENQLPMCGVLHDRKVQTHDLQKEKPIKRASCEALSSRKSSPSVSSGDILVADAESIQSNTEKNNFKSIQEQENINLHRKFLPSSVSAWKGQFQILQTDASCEFLDAFEAQAQPPCTVNRKAYNFSKEMPPVLQLESLPALNVLTGIFRDESPKLQDIALYFFPSEDNERSRKNLNSILKFMNSKKSMLRCYIDGVELLVFTSNQLDMDFRVKPEHFLWGIFRQNKIDKADGRVSDMEPVDMDIDMIGGKDLVGRVDRVAGRAPDMEPVDMDIDMIGGKDLVGRVDQIRNNKPRV